MEMRPLSAVSSPASSSGNQPESKLERAARDFEGFMVSELLRAARLDGSAGWLQEEDSAADSAFGLAQEQFSRSLSGGFGIARLVLEKMAPTVSGAAVSDPAEALRRAVEDTPRAPAKL